MPTKSTLNETFDQKELFYALVAVKALMGTVYV